MPHRTTLVCALTLGVGAPSFGQGPVWVSQFGSDLHDIALTMAGDGAGGVFVGGYTTGVLAGSTPGREDMFIARHGGDGSQLWLRQFGTAMYHERIYAIAADGAGGALAVAHTGGELGAPPRGSADIVVMRYSASGAQSWIRQYGTSAGEVPLAVCKHASGAITIGGEAFGNLAAPNAGGRDMFIARLDSSGGWVWARQFGTSEDDSVTGLAPDGSGGVFLCGTTYAGVQNGGYDIVLARYDSDGNELWTRQFGTAQNDRAAAIALDGAGGVFVCGRTYGDLGGMNLGAEDAFLVRYDGNGNELWARQFGTNRTDWAMGVAADGEGGVHVAGGTTGDLVMPSLGSYDVVLARYDRDGSTLGVQQFGTAQAEIAYTAAVSGGDVFVSGFTEGDMGGMNAGAGDVFVARLGEGGCYPDCDGNGALDIFDFLCFQDAFVTMDPYADCDGSGTLDVFDFLCFQDAITLGCP